MRSRRTHYEVLGVTRHASLPEIRRAHRELAQLLHPDHLATVPLSRDDRALAELRIREVNEAWHILGDPAARSRYDATLPDEPAPWSPPWGSDEDFLSDEDDAFASGRLRPHPRPRPSPSARPVRSQGGVRPRAAAEPGRPFHWMPLVVCGVVALIGVVALTILVGGSDGSAPGRSSAVPLAVCVVVEAGPASRVVPCDAPNDGRVVAFVKTPSQCPAGATARRLDVGDADLACLTLTKGP